jgi:hypothetical protein
MCELASAIWLNCLTSDLCGLLQVRQVLGVVKLRGCRHDTAMDDEDGRSPTDSHVPERRVSRASENHTRIAIQASSAQEAFSVARRRRH